MMIMFIMTSLVKYESIRVWTEQGGLEGVGVQELYQYLLVSG
jgi:hypothetical protein